MTVVVTGASGLIGANLVRMLLEEGRKVRAFIHQDHRALKELDIEKIEGDICDSDSLRRAFINTDVVYHLAAHISIKNEWELCESVNVIGTRNVVNTCIQTGVRRLIHCSSMSAFQQTPLEVPIDETRRLIDVGSNKHNPYDRSKAGAELEVRKGMENGLDAVIVNPTAVVGPFDFRPSLIGEFIINFARNIVPIAAVGGGVDFVDVRDVVIAAINAEKAAPSSSQYLLSGHWHSLTEFFAIMEEITGVKAPRFKVPIWLARIFLPAIAYLDIRSGINPRYTKQSLRELQSNKNFKHQKATRELDYHPRSLHETLIDTVEWFESNGYIGNK